MTLIASRVALIQLESQEAAKAGARRAAVAGRGAGLRILHLGAVARRWHRRRLAITGWPWHWIAIAASGAAPGAALLLARTARKPGAPVFPVTRAEFQKDREWIENFQKTRKSND